MNDFIILTLNLFCQDLKRIVADMSEQNDNHIGSYEIDPKYSDFIGKYTL